MCLLIFIPFGMDCKYWFLFYNFYVPLYFIIISVIKNLKFGYQKINITIVLS